MIKSSYGSGICTVVVVLVLVVGLAGLVLVLVNLRASSLEHLSIIASVVFIACLVSFVRSF